MRAAGLATMAYYYFNFRNVKKQSRYGLFSSLVSSSRENWIRVTMSSPNYIRTTPVETRKPTTDTLTKDMQNLPGQGPIYITVDALGRRSDL
jgi:hypothetical protein